MPNTMPGNVAKGRFLAQMDRLINELPENDPTTNFDRKTLQAELSEVVSSTDPTAKNPLVTKVEQTTPDCLVDK